MAGRRMTISSTVALSLYPGKIALRATFGEKMARAGMNTLLGMGTVFAVLIFICMVIHCFKYIPLLQERIKNIRKERSKVETEAIAEEKTVIKEENFKNENMHKEQVYQKENVHNEELVAVIAAAIAAAEGGSPEDFVVHSIKKRNNWYRA